MAFHFEMINPFTVIMMSAFYFFFPASLPEIWEAFSGLPESQETISVHHDLMKDGRWRIVPQKCRESENESNYKLLFNKRKSI